MVIPGYHEPLRRDRNRNGGGVLIYIAEHLIFNQKDYLQSDNYEHIWVDIRIKNASFAINALYRPPNETNESHSQFIETATNIVQQLSNYNATQKVIASDLNSGNCYNKYAVLEPKPLDVPARTTENTIR